MVHYIRFLKAPEFVSQDTKLNIKALVTVTTDLGDAFYDYDLCLHAVLLGPYGKEVCPWTKVQWKPHMRAVWIGISKQLPCSPHSIVTLLVTSSQTVDPDPLSDAIPQVIGARCQVQWPSQRMRLRTVERELQTQSGSIAIHEEIGESIARHIWDASLGLINYVERLPRHGDDKQIGLEKAMLKFVKRDRSAIRLLELGSGCGIVGIYLASSLPHCRCTLTDLPEAMENLNLNIRNAKLGMGSSLGSVVLDWQKPIGGVIKESRFDLIIVSDCTYNCDTVPALVRTVTDLLACSPCATILVSMKMRHESEGIFFELMSHGGLSRLGHASILLTSGSEERPGSDQAIEVYAYGGGQAAEMTMRNSLKKGSFGLRG